MPFTLIKGTYHVVNYSPDGDSIRFMPANPALLQQLSGPKPTINARGHVQLRIEAIDALETHYSPPSGGGPLHQPLALAQAARMALLDFVNITNVVFAGNAPEADGASVTLQEQRLKQSFHYRALAQGLAYPTYYKGLFFDLRDVLTNAVVQARKQKLGVYRNDATATGVVVNSLSVITTDHPILPKLFRRMSEYLVNTGSIKGFKQVMAKAKEPVYDLRQQNFTHFDTFIEQKGERIKLTRLPEELVFDEMPTQLTPAFSLLLSDPDLLSLSDDASDVDLVVADQTLVLS